MRDLAPDITRQRLLIEGHYTIPMDRDAVAGYLTGLARHLDLRIYGEPTIHSPGGDGKEENQGFDAFVPLIDSGISLYIWSKQRFFSALVYTCKRFDDTQAVSFTGEYFGADDIVHSPF